MVSSVWFAHKIIIRKYVYTLENMLDDVLAEAPLSLCSDRG